jgi:hypothetical protein
MCVVLRSAVTTAMHIACIEENTLFWLVCLRVVGTAIAATVTAASVVATVFAIFDRIACLSCLVSACRHTDEVHASAS